MVKTSKQNTGHKVSKKAVRVDSRRKAPKNVRRNIKSAPFLKRFPKSLIWTLIAIAAVLYVIFLFNTLVKPYSLRWNAVYREFTYPKGTIRGIDVSRYQKDIDWNELKNTKVNGDPLSFVFVKATEGSDIIDKYYNYNFYNARKSKIVRGAYHFFTTKSSAIEQARFFCRTVQLEKGDLPPVLDIETIGNYEKRRLQKEVKVWLDYVEEYYGVKPIVYSSYKFMTDYLDTDSLKKYPCWIAHYYVDSLKYEGAWTFWQHTDVGKVDGIDGFVDINVFNGSYEDLLNLTLK